MSVTSSVSIAINGAETNRLFGHIVSEKSVTQYELYLVNRTVVQNEYHTSYLAVIVQAVISILVYQYNHTLSCVIT